MSILTFYLLGVAANLLYSPQQYEAMKRNLDTKNNGLKVLILFLSSWLSWAMPVIEFICYFAVVIFMKPQAEIPGCAESLELPDSEDEEPFDKLSFSQRFFFGANLFAKYMIKIGYREDVITEQYAEFIQSHSQPPVVKKQEPEISSTKTSFFLNKKQNGQ